MIITTADRPPRGRRLPVRALLPVLIGLAFSPSSRADITFTPSVSLKETWTDNANMAPRGQERSTFITELSPAIAMAVNNQRMQLAAHYQFQKFAYSEKNLPNLRDSGSELQADLQARMVGDLLFLDASASRGQQAISAFGPGLADNPYTTNNRTNVSTWRISPYLMHRFGTSANLYARYTRDSVETGRDGYGNTDGDALSVSLANVGERRFGWNLRFDRQELADPIGGDTSSNNAQAGLSWRVMAPLMLTAGFGYDEFDYDSLGGSTRGKSWNVGYQYTPSPRTSLSMSYGRRYFGKSRALSAVHRSRQTTWNISYDESVTTTRQQFLLPATVDTAGMLSNLFAPNFPDPELRRQAVEAYMRMTGLPPTLANNINYLSNRYMLQQQFLASAGFTGVRSTMLLSLYDTRRNALSVQQVDSDLLGSNLSNLNDNTRQRGLGANFAYRLSSRSNAFALLDASRSNSLSTGIRQNNRSVRIGLNHRFQRKLNGIIELRRFQASGSANQSQTENAISAALSMTL
ncbi:MAG: TIGR03016 family PEP-CTERM system-associated outer membrane protein [Telluria sp.]